MSNKDKVQHFVQQSNTPLLVVGPVILKSQYYCQYMPTLLFLISKHLVWLSREQWYGKYKIIKDPMKI